MSVGVSVGVNVSTSAVYSEATAKRFIEDAIFLYKQAIASNDELEHKRFSRLTIMVIPFYLESLSNFLFDIFIDKKLDDVDKRSELPESIRRFRAVYNKLLNKELKDKDFNGIRDIFTVRNKITAHPAGRSKMRTTENGWEREDKNIFYYKLGRLPKVYSHFYPEHADLVFIEVRDFLTKYINSIKHKLTEEQYNYIWPNELIELKGT